MKNFEKFKTEEERFEAFTKFKTRCESCKFKKECSWEETECVIRWLDLEAEEEKPLPCPFCGGKALVNCGRLFEPEGINYWVDCVNPKCMYRSANHTNKLEAIDAHNRVAKAVMEAKKEAKESEAKHD